MLCVGEGALPALPSVYFITNAKDLLPILSPDPVVSCVADKQVSHCEIYT